MSSDPGTDGLASFIARPGYLSWLDPRLEDAERGRVRMTSPEDEKLHDPGPGGSIHGGIATTQIDTASDFSLRTTLDDPTSARLATTDLDVSCLRPTTGDLTVAAAVLRPGETLGVTVESSTADGPVAVGRTTYRLFRGKS